VSRSANGFFVSVVCGGVFIFGSCICFVVLLFCCFVVFFFLLLYLGIIYFVFVKPVPTKVFEK
jgi:hypothetical protein